MRIYMDPDGNTYARPANVAPIWRTSCYAVVRRDTRILMTKPPDLPRWELPGGGIEPGIDTSLVDAAVRECFEETGYVFTPDLDTLRFGGEALLHGPRAGFYMTILQFYVDGSVNDAPDPGWVANPPEPVEVAWIDPTTLTMANAYWFHLEGLRQAGIIG